MYTKHSAVGQQLITYHTIKTLLVCHEVFSVVGK